MKQLEIDYAFGYVFDKSKLIVMYPVGSNIISEDEYEMEVEVAFLEDGIEAAFDDNDIKVANETIKPLEMFLTKSNKVIPFVTSIKDFETKKELNKLLNEFDKEYELKDNYINKGYEIKDMYEVFKNVSNYIPKENIENLNILKIEKDKFDMNKYINSNLIPINTKKSNLTDRLYVKCDEDSTSKYIVFATDISSYSKGVLCSNKEIISNLDVDMGDLEISNIKEIGYLVNEENGQLTFKIANYILKTENNNQLAQIVDYSGIFKIMMIDFVNKFIM